METQPIREKPIGVQIKLTNKAILQFIDNCLQADKELGLHGMEGYFISYIFRHYDSPGGIRATDIAASLNVTKATASSTLHRLVDKGFITMQTIPEDAREKHISLTEKGLKAREYFGRQFGAINAVIQNRITEDQLKTLIDALEIIRQNVETANVELQKGDTL